ncbi:PaaI family thioesterase [Zavarzinia compransoris]|nr:PaaI family thioesterase [Zavarzinia compransoris]TDP48978.1 uncharacterized protein (TIGR00369 family) [Zavarzinia compransoris]
MANMAGLIETIIVAAPLARRLGIRLLAVGDGRLELALPFSPDNVTVGNTVHGGAIASLIDIVGAGLSCLVADPERHTGGATATLDVNYLRPALGIDLVGRGVILRAGRTSLVSEVEVRAPDDRLIAKGTVNSTLF